MIIAVSAIQVKNKFLFLIEVGKYQAAWSTGRTLPVGEAVALALGKQALAPPRLPYPPGD